MDAQTELLRQFVQLCKKNPAILHDPKFGFYKEYLESLGATIPPIPKKEEKTEPEVHEPEAMEEDEPPVELDMSGVIEGEKDEPLPMGDPSKEVTDEDIEKANEERDNAMAAFNEGNFDKALEHYTKAIELNPGSAILHAKRANVLLKLNKPNGAIRDCNKAISLNADSAQGYKFRGRAHRLLGNFLEAHKDLAMACKLDYDDVANEWLKEVEPNAKKLLEHQRAKERRHEESELKARQERVRRAQEEQRKAAEQEKEKEQARGDSFGAGGFGAGGVPPGFDQILKDPEILSLLKDESVMAAYTDIMKNPANMAKHMSNPKVLKLFEKLGNITGAFPAGMTPPTAGAAGQTGSTSAAPPTNKVPEPDLD
uniref:Hsc70-interacting protein n=1 Tax=Ascaris suum TaxID=6253 RepID=F1L530_ASCSU